MNISLAKFYSFFRFQKEFKSCTRALERITCLKSCPPVASEQVLGEKDGWEGTTAGSENS